MANRDKHWIIKVNDCYLKHPSGPEITKNPQEAYGCHYKSTALEYLKEFAYLGEASNNKVLRRSDADVSIKEGDKHVHNPS